ncbi:DUF6274 family protein [Streptomyces sp. NPDC056411]|uniref:DUF6274 family protein n=1 Tax=Streptomyces sp. NPDC056411 TaxID=3345813 RepID=UPI0035DC50E8
MTTAVRHETKALLRAHLAAAVGYRHRTRSCAVCHHLLRLAMEPPTALSGDSAPESTPASTPAACEPPTAEDKSPASR